MDYLKIINSKKKPKGNEKVLRNQPQSQHFQQQQPPEDLPEAIKEDTIRRCQVPT